MFPPHDRSFITFVSQHMSLTWGHKVVKGFNQFCYTYLSIILATFNYRVRFTCVPTRLASRTTCSLSRYNVKGESDCFNCKTGVLLRLFTSMFTEESNYNPRFWENNSTHLWRIFSNYIKKTKCSQSTHCCIDWVVSKGTILHQFS